MELLNPPAPRAASFAAEKILKENQQAVAKRFRHIKRLWRAIDDREAEFASWLDKMAAELPH
ncbi:MAG: hypothetical protein P1U63_07090 [Coxiellaceae bacterium]|nr:hypothetical protein [Coxiellaceae bacterium]